MMLLKREFRVVLGEQGVSGTLESVGGGREGTPHGIIPN